MSAVGSIPHFVVIPGWVARRYNPKILVIQIFIPDI